METRDERKSGELPKIWRTRTKNSVSLLVALVSLHHTAIRRQATEASARVSISITEAVDILLISRSL